MSRGTRRLHGSITTSGPQNCCNCRSEPGSTRLTPEVACVEGAMKSRATRATLRKFMLSLKSSPACSIVADQEVTTAGKNLLQAV